MSHIAKVYLQHLSVEKVTVQGGDCYLLYCRHAVCGCDTHIAAGCCLLNLTLLPLQSFCWVCHHSTQHAWLVVCPCCCLLDSDDGSFSTHLPLILEWRT